MKLSHILGAASLAALATSAVAQDADLLILDYPGFDNDAYHQTYIAAHGANPTFTFFGDEEEAFQKLVSGFRADATHICGGSVAKWSASGIIEPWDISRISAYGDIDQNLTGAQIGGGTGDVFFIPTDFGATAVAYNPDEVPTEDVASLAVFVNPKYAGRLTIPDNVDDAFALAYLATGVTDWTAVTDEQFAAATDFLRQVHPNLRTYWTDPAELAQLMSTGEILVSWAWNETYPTMTGEGRPIAYQREPLEGSSLWLCGYVNMTDGPGSEDKTYDFINAMLDPTTTQPLLDNGFGHANVAALGVVAPEVLTASGIGPITAPVLAQLPISIEQRERQAEAFELIKSGF